MIKDLPEFIMINNEKYYLEYKQIKDEESDILNGWWQAVYLKDNNSLPPQVKTNGYIEYLAVTEQKEEEMIEEMKRKLIEAKLI